MPEMSFPTSSGLTETTTEVTFLDSLESRSLLRYLAEMIVVSFATQTPAFFFLFFLYHAFIVSRYKKLRAALAMEKTKPTNQNKHKRNLKNQLSTTT